jgi:hypothetical protein
MRESESVATSNSLLRIKTIRTPTDCLNDEREVPCNCSSFQASGVEVIQPMLVYIHTFRDMRDKFPTNKHGARHHMIYSSVRSTNDHTIHYRVEGGALNSYDKRKCLHPYFQISYVTALYCSGLSPLYFSRL